MPKRSPVRTLAYLLVIFSFLAAPTSMLAWAQEVGFRDHTPVGASVDTAPAGDVQQTLAITPDPLVQDIIDQVSQDQVMFYDEQMAGWEPVWVDGAWYTIPSRDTYSGVPIQKATNWVGQHMEDLGMDVTYHQWSGPTYPNVIGEIPGQTNPDDIYIFGAHLDDVPGAPGADDNGSGSVATLIAADILSQYNWGCTIRFAFWTGEEYGLLGSYEYAQDIYAAGENVVGYLNLDMIAWNTIGSSPDLNLTYSSSIPGSYEFAQLFVDAIDAYDLDLIPHIGTLYSGSSDQASFWDFGYNSILVIEGNGYDDFNPYYHSPQDTPDNTDPAYFTNITKAALATFVHFNDCLIPSGQGAVDGTVTDAATYDPIEGAQVTLENADGDLVALETDAAGYYTGTLYVDVYTATADAIGYYPAVVGGVAVITDTITMLDFALEPMDTPEAEFSSNGPVKLGQAVAFTNESAGAEPISYAWDFGDGEGTSTEVNPTYTYAETGTFTVTLTATNEAGEDTVAHTVVVEPAPELVVLPGEITMTLGMTQTGSTSLVLANSGDGDLLVSGVTDGAGWLTIPITTPLTVTPGGEFELVLGFDPTGLMTGTYTTTVRIASDDPVQPEVEVPITFIVKEEWQYMYSLFLALTPVDIHLP